MASPVFDEKKETDGTELDPEVRSDHWSLLLDDMIYMISYFEKNDHCYRKLLLGMKSVDAALRGAIYSRRYPLDFQTLWAIFRTFGHEVEFGHCKLKGLYNSLVIMVKEAGQTTYLVHEVRYSKPSVDSDVLLYHIDPDYRVFHNRRPTLFKHEDVCAKVYWFDGESNPFVCLPSSNHPGCEWLLNDNGVWAILFMVLMTGGLHMLMTLAFARFYSVPLRVSLFYEGARYYFSVFMSAYASTLLWIGLESFTTALCFLLSSCYYITQEFMDSRRMLMREKTNVTALQSFRGYRYTNIFAHNEILADHFAKLCNATHEIPRFPTIGKLLGICCATGLVCRTSLYWFQIEQRPPPPTADLNSVQVEGAEVDGAEVKEGATNPGPIREELVFELIVNTNQIPSEITFYFRVIGDYVIYCDASIVGNAFTVDATEQISGSRIRDLDVGDVAENGLLGFETKRLL